MIKKDLIRIIIQLLLTINRNNIYIYSLVFHFKLLSYHFEYENYISYKEIIKK